MSSELISQIEHLQNEIKKQIKSVPSQEDLESIRIHFFGKKGKFTSILKQLGTLPPEERTKIGLQANQSKNTIQKWFDHKTNEFKEQYYENLKITEWMDMTILPKAFPNHSFLPSSSGTLHPITIMQKKIEDIFTSMGFDIMDGPQVELDFYNFKALNFSDDHPARDMQDTFYTTEKYLLRTHTSSIQVRTMENNKPPLRILAPGRVFRREEVDASHEHTFYQIEGMIVDKNISISNLLYLMKTLLSKVFASILNHKKEVEVRLRPGYFPFVEPGFELDIQCFICSGDGCNVCKHSGWVELLPCGLVHPKVIEASGLDPQDWQGAAFGLGLNRLVMMYYGIEDIRYFQEAKLDFLNQF